MNTKKSIRRCAHTILAGVRPVRGLFVAVFAALLSVSAPQAQPESAPSPVAGSWTGELSVGGMSLPLVFNITSGPNAAGSTMDSPKQGVKGIPVASVSFDAKGGRGVRIEIAAIKGYFEGTTSEAGDRLTGTWNQAGASFPLTLVRASKPFVLDRPQEPLPPFPYRTEEARIASSAQGVTLAASLVLPPGPGPFPAVVMVTGSGAQNRDEEILGHKPFLVIADYLARRGIASLRYDDRGFAASTGDFASATTFDLAADARSACEWLIQRPEIDTLRLGILGHSEGGIIAPIVASQMPGIGFLVLLAGPGVPGSRILEAQGALIARASGQSETAIRETAGLNRKLYAAALQNLPEQDLVLSVRTVYMEGIQAMTSLSPAEKAEAQQDATRTAMTLTSPWFRSFMALDPATYLAKTTVPVLALNGSKDLQVPGEENLAAIRACLPEESRARSRFLLLDGLNHLFQHAGTGLPKEYGDIAQTFSPEALGLIADWVLNPGAPTP